MFEANDNPENNEGFKLPEIEFDLDPPQDFSNFLDLRQPFDGDQPEIPPEEKQAVNVEFSASIDDCLLTNIAFAGSHRSDTSVYLEWDYGNDEDRLRIYVEALDGARSVTVRHIEDPKIRRHGAHYYSRDDGTIVRHDLGDSLEIRKRNKALSDSLMPEVGDSHEEFLRKQNELFRYEAEKSANEELEELTGVNRQPIS